MAELTDRLEYSAQQLLERMLQVFLPAITVSLTRPGDLMVCGEQSTVLGLFRSVGIDAWRIQVGETAWEEYPDLPMAVRRFVERTHLKDYPCIPRMALRNGGSNPNGYTAEATYTGDPGIYDELRISIFDREDDCVGDVLVGLTTEGEPRVLVTTGNAGDGDHNVSIYPCRHIDDAVIIMGTGA